MESAGLSGNNFPADSALVLQSGEPLNLDIFLDKSVLEIFANGRQCVTQVVYPELETSNRLKVFSGADAVRVKNIRAWPMADTNAF